MVFKILTEEEKAFLTDKQLEQYEDRLEKHRQRVDFVEKLDRLENVELKPYTAKKVTVRKINKVQVSDITLPERIITMENHISQKISEYKLFNKMDSHRRVVETNITLKNIQDRGPLNLTVIRCSDIPLKMKVPDIKKVKIEKTECIVPEIRKSEVPKAVLSNIPQGRSDISEKKIKVSMPVPQISDVKNESEIKAPKVMFKAPEYKINNISTPEVETIRVKKPVLDKFSISAIPQKNDYNMTKPEITDLPSASVKVPYINICSDIPVHKFEKKEFKVKKTPVIASKIQSVRKPEMPSANVKMNVIQCRHPEKTVIRQIIKPDIKLSTSVPHTPEIPKIGIKIPGAKINGMSGTIINKIPEVRIQSMPCVRITGMSDIIRPDNKRID